jgi:hypothetical protein
VANVSVRASLDDSVLGVNDYRARKARSEHSSAMTAKQTAGDQGNDARPKEQRRVRQGAKWYG